ncbi:hypothetical protein [Xylanimonas protaetiae]|uniref:Uncharacterized protein n=1 Tax=Xylanimonas protaetiae TaxID=2509457 RepID=A0A4P6F274_9MICO|nr:hypothetical protein [Xylanimonas protaetiae]QAY69604.1 hypothetical protein ET471_05750 [Xylanimonas protaetiae]
MRRWVTVWVGVVVGLLVVWGVVAVLAYAMTTHDDGPASAAVLRTAAPADESHVTAVVSQAPGGGVRPAPRAVEPAGGTAVVPEGWSVEEVAGLSLAVPPAWDHDDTPWPAVDHGAPADGWRSLADLVGPGKLPAQLAVTALPASWDDATGGWSDEHAVAVPGARQASLATTERSTGSGGTLLEARVVVRKTVGGPAQVVDLRLPPASSGGRALLDQILASLSLR